jgi:cytochrome P450
VFLIRPLLRTRLFEMVGGKSVADNNRLIDYASSQVEVQHAEMEMDKGTNHDRIDFLSRLIGTEDKKTGWRPTIADLGNESLNMINAGADPFSSVLAGAIFYLVHNPTCLEKSIHEVRSTFSSTSEIINGPALNSCTYLYAVIEETLRRVAPVPSHLPRVVLEGGMDIDGHHISAGAVVGVPMYALHNNPDYFPSPFTFLPERWIESPSNSAENIALARKAFCPFSIGSRMCSGRSLAYMQLKLTLAHVLWRFDIREAPDEMGRGGGSGGLGIGRERRDEFQMWDALGFGRDGPVVEVRSVQ